MAIDDRKVSTIWQDGAGSSEPLTVACIAGHPIKPNMITALRTLARLVGDEVHLVLIMGPGEVPEVLDGHYHIYQVESPRLRLVGVAYAFRAVWTYLRSHKPDLILNAASPFPVGGPMVLLAKWFKVPSLLRVNTDFLAEADKYKKPIARWRRQFVHGVILSAVFRRADYVGVFGPTMGRKLTDHGFDPARVVMLQPPVIADDFRQASNSIKIQQKSILGLETNRRTILFAGRLTWGKGADRTLEIVRRIGVTSSDFQFCLVGESHGGFGDILSAMDDELVHVVGLVPNDQMRRYYDAADLLIHPSRNEGAPYAVMEAMAYGLPVLASPVGEVPDLLPVTASQPDEYVDYILNQKWIRHSLPARYNWDQQREAYLNFFSRVARQRNASKIVA